MWITLGLWLSCTEDIQKERQQIANPIVAEKTAAILEGSNVVFILMDTLRADRLGSYGYSIDISPNLDKLANEGVRFEKHFATSSWTRPSTGTIFTGHHPRTLGLYEEMFDQLPEEFVTIAERFKAKGYKTYGVTSNPNVNSFFGFSQGFDKYEDAGMLFKWMEQANKEISKELLHLQLETATTITNRTLDLINSVKLSESKQPYFLIITYIDSHKPYQAPSKYKKFTEKHRSRTSQYDAGVQYADYEIGRLLKEMKTQGLLDNTTIIFTSDHGEGLKSHPKIPNSHGHGLTLYDSTVRVPLFVHHPSLKANVISQLNSSIDLMPTWIELFALKADSTLPGVSIAPWISGFGTVQHPGVAFLETEMKAHDKIGVRTNTHSFIINNDVKLYQEEGIHENYNLRGPERQAFEQSPFEELYLRDDLSTFELYTKNNIIETDAEIATELRNKINDFLAQNKYREPQNRSPKDALTLPNGKNVFPYAGKKIVDIDENTRKSLEQLGYLENDK